MFAILSPTLLALLTSAAVSAQYVSNCGNSGTAIISLSTLLQDNSNDGPLFAMDFSDSSVGSPLVVTNESPYDSGAFYAMLCGEDGQEYAYFFTDPNWPDNTAANTPAYFPSVSSGLCITAADLDAATTTLVAQPCDPGNNPAQVFQVTAGNFVDATITFIGSQTSPTFLNKTSYSAALAGSSPQYVEITTNTGNVPPVTPSTVSLILTLQDD